MARANETTEPGVERNSDSFMPHTIAGAIRDSKCDFNKCYRAPKMDHMNEEKKKPKPKRTPPDPEHQKKLQELVDLYGGGDPEIFAERRTVDPEKPVNPIYVRMILNGHTSFGDRARKILRNWLDSPRTFLKNRLYRRQDGCQASSGSERQYRMGKTEPR